MLRILLIAFLLSYNLTYSQTEGTFRSPLEIPIYLSGTFAELRNNHFHGGLDIKTNGQQGYKVLSIEDGYVSRIKSSATGYGNALYINHPNGYTSVYGHLSKFNDQIEEYLTRQQYHSHSFEQDLYLSAGQLPVTKGQMIALSGNSGSSAGPHLHFEIRNTGNQAPINPLRFISVQDNINPTIYGLRVHELTTSFYHSNSKTYKAKYISPGVYRLNTPVIVNQPIISFSIRAIDKLNGSNNSNGFSSLRMYADDVLSFAYVKDEIPFDKTRYLNAHIDYPYSYTQGSKYSNCFKLPGNTLNIYQPGADDGRIWLSNFPKRAIKIEVSDFNGNTSTLEFDVEYKTDETTATPTFSDPYFPYSSPNSFSETGVYVSIPAFALYDDIYFRYNSPSLSTDLPLYSKFHQIHDPEVPLQKYMMVQVEAIDFPQDLRNKAVMANMRPNGSVDINTGDWSGNYFQTKTRNFGTFFITTDTKAPVIRQYYPPSGNNFSNSKTMQFTIGDDLSGIKDYRVLVDGQWVLFEYDKKRARLIHTFTDRIAKGSHNLVLTVTDKCDNTNTYELNFTR